MAQVTEPCSLLVAVRSELSLDSDSESSTSPDAASHSDKPTTSHQTSANKPSSDAHSQESQHSYESHADEQSSFSSSSSSTNTTIHGSDCNSGSTPTNQTFLGSSFSSTSTLPTEHTIENTSFSSASLEAFPEYDETDLETYVADEIAYREAFTAAMHEHIRTEQVDPFLVDAESPGLSDVKIQSLETLKEYLSHPHLHAATRGRFISLTNMILRLERTLFHQYEEFLSPDATKNAQEIAVVLLGYAAWVDGVMEELLVVTRRVRFVLGKMMEENVAEVLRYRNMACVVSNNLKKPRAPEQILLAQFAEVYDNWVHDKFLALRNRQILVEKNVDPDRLQLTRYLHAIWEILLRAVQAYAVYREVLTEIRETYFHAISGTTDGTLELCSKELMVVI